VVTIMWQSGVLCLFGYIALPSISGICSHCLLKGLYGLKATEIKWFIIMVVKPFKNILDNQQNQDCLWTF